MKQQKSIKKRNWGFIMYPESAPSDWKSILESTGLMCAISPLHDRDVWSAADEKKNPAHKAGDLKKAHYHVLLHFDGPTTESAVRAVADKVFGSLPVAVESLKGSYDYLSHENNDDKAKYSKDDIVCLNGFRIENLTELSKDEILKIKKDIHKIIIELDIMEYSDLMSYLLMNDLDAEYRIASTSTIHFGKLIDSYRHKNTGK